MKKKLFFDLCEQFTEKYGKLTENIHVIGDKDPYYGMWTYRVYHKKGYCWDVKKQEASLKDYDLPYAIDGFIYSFSETWEGFKNKGIDKAIKLIQKELA